MEEKKYIPNFIIVKKICNKCKQEKSLTEFTKNKQGKWGYHSICKECKNKKQRKFREETNYDKEWREKNKDKTRKIWRGFYYKNHKKEKRRNRIKQKRARILNPAKFKERDKKGGKLITTRFRRYKKGAKQRNLFFDLSISDFQKIVEQPCSYCGEKDKERGVDRENNNKGYIKPNCVPCCFKCNYMKRDWTKEDFINQCKKITRYFHTPNEVDY